MSTLAEFVSTNDPTRAFVSLARQPGNFGRRVYKAAFDYLGLPYTYSALVCSDIEADMALVREHQILGASITMPHKAGVLGCVDDIHPIAAEIGGANTVVNRDGGLTAYNTDYCGVEAAMQFVVPSDHIAVIGKGTMAKTFGRAARCSVDFLGRNDLGWGSRQATVVVNASPMGMPGIETPKGLLDRFPNCDYFVECVVNETPLLLEAERRGITVFRGLEIAFQQAFAQFQLYTGIEAPVEIMRAAIS